MIPIDAMRSGYRGLSGTFMQDGNDKNIEVTPGATVPDLEEHSVRVVYSFSTVEFIGTNTQYLKLKKDDVLHLKEVLRKLETK